MIIIVQDKTFVLKTEGYETFLFKNNKKSKLKNDLKNLELQQIKMFGIK